jgi:hypothetical protein
MVRVEVSHPCDKTKSQGWGTGLFVDGEKPKSRSFDYAQDDKL